MVETFSGQKLFGMTIRESATDGSDFTNPDADYRRLFLGEDGQLYVKDAAGTVTGIGGSVTELSDLPTAETVATKVLRPDGAGGVAWAAEGGGSLVLLEQHAASGGVVDFTSCISSTFDEYLIELLNVQPDSYASRLLFRCSTDGGATYDAGSSYAYAGWTWGISAGTAAGSESTTSIDLSSGGDISIGVYGACGLSGSFRLYRPLDATHKRILGNAGYTVGGSQVATTTSGEYRPAENAAVNAFRFLISAGSMVGGTIRVYGVAKS